MGPQGRGAGGRGDRSELDRRGRNQRGLRAHRHGHDLLGVGIPVVASGGAGSPEHILAVFREGGADAALVASMVHYGDGASPPSRVSWRATGSTERLPDQAAFRRDAHRSCCLNIVGYILRKQDTGGQSFPGVQANSSSGVRSSGVCPHTSMRCTKCGHTFEAFQSIVDKPLTRCPKCKSPIRRVINGGLGVIFKGSGFYSTDNKKGSVSRAATAALPRTRRGRPRSPGTGHRRNRHRISLRPRSRLGEAFLGEGEDREDPRLLSSAS